VFLLDDHEIVRRGVRELLEANDDIEIVGEAGTAEEGMARIRQVRSLLNCEQVPETVANAPLLDPTPLH
jgi:DNA-binding NarL/FixJ family response regulator